MQVDAAHLLYDIPIKPRPGGLSELVLTPLELFDKIAALVPLPVPVPAAGTPDDAPQRAAARYLWATPLARIDEALAPAPRYAAQARHCRAFDHASGWVGWVGWAIDTGAAPADIWSRAVETAILLLRSISKKRNPPLQGPSECPEWVVKSGLARPLRMVMQGTTGYTRETPEYFSNQCGQLESRTPGDSNPPHHP